MVQVDTLKSEKRILMEKGLIGIHEPPSCQKASQPEGEIQELPYPRLQGGKRNQNRADLIKSFLGGSVCSNANGAVFIIASIDSQFRY